MAVAVFILAIAPGFLAVRGYSRRRYRSLPDRDLYALAQAIVISAIWLSGVWLLLLLLGDPIERWGIMPSSSVVRQEHRADIVLVGLLVMLLPYGIGMTAAAVVDKLEGTKSDAIWKWVRRTGLVRPPTAWDRAWLRFIRQQGSGQVIVRLKSGLVVRGGYGRHSSADLSPSPHQLFLESGYAYTEGDDGETVEVEAVGRAGIFIEGSEIVAIYFQPE